ncbi:MAG: hypothetical protein NTY20_01480 [Candidatus Aenigmarchaeota archaeon]|nr:hypothetical protein [Candidatus Aenigmarchaeota archaeon]
MTVKLLPDEISRQIRNIYNGIRDYSGYCLNKSVCSNFCCTDEVPMSYVEFAYLSDFLHTKLPEEKVKEVLKQPKILRENIIVEGEKIYQLISLDGKNTYSCKILDDSGCIAYLARPFRCRTHIRDERTHIRDYKRGLCRPQGSEEIDHKSWRRVWRLDDSIQKPGKAKKENYIDFWAREIGLIS